MRDDSVINLTNLLINYLTTTDKNSMVEEGVTHVALSIAEIAVIFGVYPNEARELKRKITKIIEEKDKEEDKKINNLPVFSNYNNYQIVDLISRLDNKTHSLLKNLLKHFTTNYMLSYRKGYKLQLKVNDKLSWRPSNVNESVKIDEAKSKVLLEPDFLSETTGKPLTEIEVIFSKQKERYYTRLNSEILSLGINIIQAYPAHIFMYSGDVEDRLAKYNTAWKVDPEYVRKVKQKVLDYLETNRNNKHKKESEILYDLLVELGINFSDLSRNDIDQLASERKLYTIRPEYMAKDRKLGTLIVDKEEKDKEEEEVTLNVAYPFTRRAQPRKQVNPLLTNNS
jgi:hypothetical protein